MAEDLTTPRSLEVTKLTLLLPVSSSSWMFHTFTSLSVPPVAMHPLRRGLTSMEDAGPSWAASVNREGDGSSRFDDNVLTSKFKMRPFSSETCSKGE